jgi:16S rRNA (cytosine1402-N4)-methyltransferase
MLFTPPTLALEARGNPAATRTHAQVSESVFSFFPDKFEGSGHRSFLSFQTDDHTTPGWCSVWHPLTFMAGRTKSLGTELLALFMTMVRTAPGWLSVRPSNFLLAGRGKSLGTEIFALFRTMVRTAPGWLSVRPSAFFLHTAEAHEATALGAGDYHLPVFPAEIGDWMAAAPGKFIIDGTLGGGGHSEIFLKAGARVLGVDRDPEALAHARARLAEYGGRFSTWEGNFSQLADIPDIQQGDRADGLLLDLGVSSRQLDSASRGFSFMREGPLDMRMGPTSPRTAAEIVNHWPEAEIVRILFEFGEESKARRIAGAIVKHRESKRFETTLDLANCIERAIGRHGRTHPATKTFQAIRMAVNEELESLSTALAAAPQILKPGGLFLIITFHSLEDRMVKRFFKHRSTAFLDEPGWPEPRPNPDYQFRLLARKSIAPTAQEISSNPRARSAKLRVAQLLHPTP